MQIAFFEIQPWEQERLKEVFAGEDLSFFEGALKEENLASIRDCDALSVFIYSEVNENVIKALPKLKLIATRSTGYDHIDVKAAKERGIVVSNIPSYGENTVAEHTFALILSLSRNVHRSHVRRLRNNFSIEGLKGFDLKGKTLGVVGTGKIGRNVIQIAKGFGMHILGYDTFPNEALAKEMDFSYVSLPELLAGSDIITLHAPYLKETHHLINEENIKQVKPGAMLINTARGELVDNDAILWALDHKVLAGCGLDVIEGEELIREEKELLYQKDFDREKMAELVKDHILLGREEVVYTPHIAFYSKEALERILSTTIENIHCYTKGSCQNAVGEAK
ncbi:MAG: hydroxyacid dehydrogenase [Candidatus Moraniibacteriota bacterium]